MERGPCILVFGVSGVGKTLSCQDYVARHPEWLHLRADGFILLEVPVETLAARRADANRTRPLRSDAGLAREVRMERETVRSYAALLDIPLASAQANDNFQLDALIDTLVKAPNG